MIRHSVFHAVHNAVACDHFERKEHGTGQGADTSTRNESVRQVKNLADAELALKEFQTQLSGFIQKATGEISESGKISIETKAAVQDIVGKIDGAVRRIDAIEAKYNRRGEALEAPQTPGHIFIESDTYKAMGSQGRAKTARKEFKTLLGNMETRAIVNATGQNQPLVPDYRIGMISPIQRRLTIRDLLPVGRVSSNLVQFVVELLFTNNAGPQVAGSPTAASENATKPESDITFQLQNAAVVTLAHYILASKQVLDDAPMLQSYIDGRLMYGLKLEEEDELLNGDGSAGQLNGLFNQATAYNRSGAGTKIDILRRMQTQVALADMDLDWYVLNPSDWEEIELTKDTTGQYVLARPESLAPPRLWGKPIVPTNAITATYALGGSSMAAQIWDREDASVELSREDGDNFKKNMVTILAEERLALTVYRPTALIKVGFSS